MISFDRCDEYSNIEPETQKSRIENGMIDRIKEGAIEFSNFALKYRENLPPFPNKINLKINSKEKIGILGKAGSGKSSLFLVLLRIIDGFQGKIWLDGDDITKIKIEVVINCITLISQDHLILISTLRKNLDPLGIYSDHD